MTPFALLDLRRLAPVVLTAVTLTLAPGAFAHEATPHATSDAATPAVTVAGRIVNITVINRATNVKVAYPALELADGQRYRLESVGATATGTPVSVTGRLAGHTLTVSSMAGATAQAAPMQQKSSVRGERTGTIRVFHIDYVDGTSEFGYDLRDDNGRGNIVDINMPLPGVENGSRATISGPADANGYVHVDTIEVLGSKPQSGPNAKATAATANKDYAVVPLTFSGSQPVSVSTIDSSVFGALPTFKSAKEYYKEVSFGLQTLTGFVISAAGPAWLQSAVAMPSCNTSTDLNNLLGVIEAQAQALAATAANNPTTGLTWGGYGGGILYVIDALPGGAQCGWAGLGYIGFARAYTNGTASLSVVGHEMGHNFGLLHAGSVRCATGVVISTGCSVTEYGDPYVIMGNVKAGHFNAYQKDLLNYIPGGIATHTTGSTTYNLGPIESPGQSLYGIQIPTSNPNRTYWVEFRQSIGFDAGFPGIGTIGAQIRVASPMENLPCGGCTNSDDTEFLDLTPSNTSFTDGALASGLSYTDSTVSPPVTINVLSGSASSLSVQVVLGASSATTTTLASSVNPSSVGQSVTFTATVAGTNPTGSVTFKDSSTTLCNAVALTGSGNTRTAPCATTALTAGVHSITATYSGDVSNNTSVNSPLSQTVKSATTTSVASSKNPSTSGASVTFTATVAGTAPTGNVAFTSDGATISGCSALALSGSGNSRIAACTTSALTVATHSVVASYAGDSANGASTSSAVSQAVNTAGGGGPAATTTALASSSNPSTSGSAITFTATVNGTAPTGNVAFTSDGGSIVGCSTIALAGSGNTRTADCTTAALAIGAHSIVATYAGNAGNAASANTPLSQVVSAAVQVPTVTTVTASANPVTAGMPLAIVATIASTPPVGGGAVNFSYDGVPIIGCSNVPVTGAGGDRVATCNTQFTPGAYSMIAAYTGDASSKPSSSLVYSQVAQYPSIGNTVQIATSSYTVNEAAGNVVITVTRIGDVSAPAQVSYATVGGTATANVDYTPVSGSLSWAANDSTTRTITVPIADDGIAELPQTFGLALSNPVGATIAGTGTTITIYDDDGATTLMPGNATVTQNPYGALTVQGATLVGGNTITNLQKNVVIQLGNVAGGAGSSARIDFQGFTIGEGNTLTIRSGAAGQTVYLTNVDATPALIRGILQAQGGGAAPAPAIVVQSVAGITVDQSGRVVGPGGLAIDTLSVPNTTGGDIVNLGWIDGGTSLKLSAAKVNGSGLFYGNALTFVSFGHLNNPVNGSHFLANSLQLYPSTGNAMSIAVAAYGSAPQYMNLMAHGNATFTMPSAWPNGSTLPLNNRPVMPGAIQPAGTPLPPYGASSIIVRATGNLTLDGGVSGDLIFAGGLVLIAGGTLDVHGASLDNGWNTAGQPFQGVYFEAPTIVDSTGAPINVRTNQLNWANFSTRPLATVKTWTLQQQLDGTRQFIAADGAVPHLNFYWTSVEAAAQGQCWTCLANGQTMDFSVAP